MRETTQTAASSPSPLDPPWDVPGTTPATPAGAPVEDDGTREAAVELIGEGEVRAYEIETVRMYAHFSRGFFTRLGIPQDSIDAGYALAAQQAGGR